MLRYQLMTAVHLDPSLHGDEYGFHESDHFEVTSKATAQD